MCVCVYGCVSVLVTQSYPTFCKPMDIAHQLPLRPWDSPGKNTGVSCHSLLQGIFPTQGSNLGPWHCRQILCHLSHQGSPKGDQWTCIALSLSECLKSSKGPPWWASPCPRPAGSSPFLPGLLNVTGAFPAPATGTIIHDGLLGFDHTCPGVGNLCSCRMNITEPPGRAAA